MCVCVCVRACVCVLVCRCVGVCAYVFRLIRLCAYISSPVMDLCHMCQHPPDHS